MVRRCELLARGYGLLVCGSPQLTYFRFVEFAHFPRLDVEDQRTKAHPPDLLDKMAYFLEHLADFPVLALGQDDFVPRVVGVADQADACRLGHHTAFAL